MSTSAKRWMLAAVCLLVVGGLIFLAALASMKFDFTRLNTRKMVTNSYSPAGDFGEVLVELDTARLRFLPSEDGKCRVDCVEETGHSHVVSVEQGKLTIQEVDTEKVVERLGFGFGETSVTVYLPQSDYDSLTVKTSTGDVDIPESFRFGSILINGSTSDVSCRASVGGRMEIVLGTGSITLGGIRAGEAELRVSTGRVEVSDAEITGTLSVRATTGKVRLSDLRCADVDVTTSTGGADFVRVLASGSLRAEMSTGDVRFTDSDAGEIYVKTTTGDVTGSLLTEKVFLTGTDTGKVKVPRSVTGGRCEITTDTGDIEIDVP